MTKTQLFSDPHFGDGGPADDFGPDDGAQAVALRAKCAEWKRAGDDVIAVGDIGEFWQFTQLEVQRAHGDTMDALKEVLSAYVRGNHDRKATRDFLGLEPLPYLILGETFIVHGDFLDWWVAHQPELCRRICNGVGWLERRIHGDVDVWASSAWHWFTRTGRHGRNAKYLGPLAQAGYERGCTRAVFGHTHEFGSSVAPVDGQIMDLRNTGCWIGDEQGVVTLMI